MIFWGQMMFLNAISVKLIYKPWATLNDIWFHFQVVKDTALVVTFFIFFTLSLAQVFWICFFADLLTSAVSIVPRGYCDYGVPKLKKLLCRIDKLFLLSLINDII